MKKEALSRGAEEEPISSTLGMESGRGVVSMRTCWLNLGRGVSVERWSSGEGHVEVYRGCLPDMVAAVRVQWVWAAESQSS